MNARTQPRTIVDVMTGLFGRLFPQPAWRPWVLCAAAIYGLTYGLDADDQAFILRCLGRTRLPQQRAQRVVLTIGRRGGKSRFASFLAVFLACFVDYSKVLSAGERGTGMIVAPDRRQARTCFRYISAFLEHVPMLAGMVESRTKEAIHLRNGISIEVHTASFRSVRGYSVVFAIIDEAAFLPSDDSSEPDVELVAALLPAMATTGGMLILISSPYAKRGEIWRAVREHFGKDDDPILVWRAGTREMNPTIPESLVAQAYEDDPARAASEWGAEFRNDIEGFLTREALESVRAPGRLVLPRMAREYVAFVDPAGSGGLNADSYTGAIAHLEGSLVVLDSLFERRPPFSPESTTEDLAVWLKSYGVTVVRGDRYAGEWPRAELRKHGINYEPSEKSKSDLYREFLPLVNSGGVELLDHARLLAQLGALERRVARGGRDSIDHPPGGHDDIGNAAAGACVWAAERKPGRKEASVSVIRVRRSAETLPEEMARLRAARVDETVVARLVSAEATERRLRPVVERHGSAAVEQVLRHANPGFTLPESLQNIQPAGGTAQ